MPRELQPCGTPAAYRRHLYHNEVPCRACTDAVRTYQRELMRAVRGGGPRQEPKPCGTTAAYNRHNRRGEKPCQACAQAWADYMAAYKAQSKSSGDRQGAPRVVERAA